MLVFSVIRIGFMEDFETVTGFMISFYLVLFAIMFICVECNLKKSRLWFYFLNSSLGKGLFHMFCFLLCFGSAGEPSWVDVLLGIIFFLTSVVMFIIFCFFKSQEGPFIDQLIAQAKTGQASSASNAAPSTASEANQN